MHGHRADAQALQCPNQADLLGQLLDEEIAAADPEQCIERPARPDREGLLVDLLLQPLRQVGEPAEGGTSASG
ncbi:hypothetical protein ACFQY5_41525 [Paeniroseomonas aquatica]|uniref:hypothetical protein n=1 Tax=Paeniroseomonas aquatica TaxID=373043 RepID=UPI00361F3031